MDNPSKIYHKPHKNKILEIQKKIEEVKKQEKEKIHVNLNQQITSKLNLPAKEQVYKNLQPIYREKSKKAQNIFNETNRKLKETKNKDKIEEIDEMLKRLKSLEEPEEKAEPKNIKLTNEDEYFRFNRQYTQNQKPKAADRRFQQELVRNCVAEISASDDFNYFVPEYKRQSANDEEKEEDYGCSSCNCDPRLLMQSNHSNHRNNHHSNHRNNHRSNHRNNFVNHGGFLQ